MSIRLAPGKIYEKNHFRNPKNSYSIPGFRFVYNEFIGAYISIKVNFEYPKKIQK